MCHTSVRTYTPWLCLCRYTCVWGSKGNVPLRMISDDIRYPCLMWLTRVSLLLSPQAGISQKLQLFSFVLNSTHFEMPTKVSSSRKGSRAGRGLLCRWCCITQQERAKCFFHREGRKHGRIWEDIDKDCFVQIPLLQFVLTLKVCWNFETGCDLFWGLGVIKTRVACEDDGKLIFRMAEITDFSLFFFFFCSKEIRTVWKMAECLWFVRICCSWCANLNYSHICLERVHTELTYYFITFHVSCSHQSKRSS